MPKNSKTENSNGSSAEIIDSPAAVEIAPEPKKQAKRAKTAAKKSAAKKTSGAKGAKKTSAQKSAKKSKSYEPSDDEIRLRAYFIAERRAQMSLEGDPGQDWLDARQQLIDESGQSRS